VVVWQVDLPQNARSAVFQTQVLVEGGGTARIFVQRGNGPATEVISAGPATEGGGTEVLIPLMEPAGQKVTLVLTTTGAGRALFRYPVIDLYTNPGPETASVVRPENLDPMNLPPLPTTVDLLRGRPWKGVSGPLPRGGGQMLGPSEFMEMTEPLDRPASDFERLAVTVRVDPRVSPSALRVFFHMLNTSGEVTDPSVVLTLLPDGKSHVYTYPLKLLEADQRTLFRGMRLFSVSGGGPVEIQEVRLIPREASPAASAADTQ
jgi:hypothetical protein